MSRSNILHTEAVVLRSIDFSETSKIVTFFTLERGKMGVIAKGARATKSRFGSTLEPMNQISVVIHCKEGRDLQILSEASHVQHHNTLRSSLDRMETGLRIIELMNALMQSDQKNEKVFSLLISSLTALDIAPGRTTNLWPFFQLRLASILGFEPAFESDIVKLMETEAGVLDLKSGRIASQSDAGFVAVRSSRKVLRAFAVLARATLSDVMRMELDGATAAEVESLVASYLRHHVEDQYPTRSARVFAQLAPDG